MSEIVVDTSIWIDFFAGETMPALEDALADGRAVLPPIVIAELMSGAREADQKRILTEMLENVPMFDAGRAHWIRVGELRRSLAGKGLAVSVPDAHVAQCAVDLGAALLTRDRVFRAMASHTSLALAADA